MARSMFKVSIVERGKRRGGEGGEGIPVDPKLPNILSGVRRRRLSLEISECGPELVCPRN